MLCRIAALSQSSPRYDTMRALRAPPARGGWGTASAGQPGESAPGGDPRGSYALPAAGTRMKNATTAPSNIMRMVSNTICFTASALGTGCTT